MRAASLVAPSSRVAVVRTEAASAGREARDTGISVIQTTAAHLEGPDDDLVREGVGRDRHHAAGVDGKANRRLATLHEVVWARHVTCERFARAGPHEHRQTAAGGEGGRREWRRGGGGSRQDECINNGTDGMRRRPKRYGHTPSTRADL